MTEEEKKKISLLTIDRLTARSQTSEKSKCRKSLEETCSSKIYQGLKQKQPKAHEEYDIKDFNPVSNNTS
jgi:hypothetical protein